jgi:hypothetical protein
MKKALIVIGLILVSLAVLLPFASSNPDGLEQVTSTYGMEEQSSGWQGLMAGYSIAGIDNSYVSTLLAGSIGVAIVLTVGLLLGKAMPKKSVVQVKENQ